MPGVIGLNSPSEPMHLLVIRNVTKPVWAVVSVAGLAMPGEANSFYSFEFLINMQQATNAIYAAPIDLGPVQFEFRGLAPFCPLAGSVSGPALLNLALTINAFYGVANMMLGYSNDSITFPNSVITSFSIAPFGPNVPFSSVSIRGVSQW